MLVQGLTSGTHHSNTMAQPTRDPQNPYSVTTSNDAGAELVDLVVSWYRSHRNLLNATQQTNVINAITSILNGTFKV